MAVINKVTEVLHKIEAKLYPNYLGKEDDTDKNPLRQQTAAVNYKEVSNA